MVLSFIVFHVPKIFWFFRNIQSFPIPTPNSTKHEMSETEKIESERSTVGYFSFIWRLSFFLLKWWWRKEEEEDEEEEKKSSIGSCLNNSREDLWGYFANARWKTTASLLILLSSSVRTKHLLDLYNRRRFWTIWKPIKVNLLFLTRKHIIMLHKTYYEFKFFINFLNQFHFILFTLT